MAIKNILVLVVILSVLGVSIAQKVSQKKGLFTSDSALLDDPETKSYIETQVATGGSSFAKVFSDSMLKLGLLEVLTGNKGEIRKKCAFVN
ncbi:unnamed protein product [Arabis nemorensis]|uniref:peroxidase n=1 Tax=Arabis nemorensis TaxID=586526 RepID=A0A565AM11_9BRAS|nr:unnamed protein product [Arabis nemorensis]